MFKENGMKYTGYAIGILTVGVMIGDVVTSGRFGATLGGVEMIIYGLISLASGLVLVGAALVAINAIKADNLLERYVWGTLATILAIAWLPMFGFNIFSNMGVLSASRMGDVQQANLTNARFDEVKSNKTEIQQQIKGFIGMRKTLQSQFDAMTKAQIGGWSVKFVSASSQDLAKLVDNKHDEMLTEKGRGGCGRKCDERRLEMEHLMKLQGLAAKIEQNERQMAKAELGLGKARTKLENTEPKISSATNQSTLHAKLINWEWNSDPDAKQVDFANQILGMASAAVLAITATVLALLQAAPKLLNYLHAPTNYQTPNTGTHSNASKAPITASAMPVPQSVASDNHLQVVHLDDRSVKDKIRQALGPRYGQQVAA